MNVYTIMGNMGRDPELRYTQTGTAVANVSVAVKAGFGENESTTWVKCTFWGKKAEIVEKYFSKGSRICCTGEIRTDEYEDRDGNKRTSWELNVNDFDFVDKKGDGPAARPDGPGAPPSQSFDDEDIPF